MKHFCLIRGLRINYVGKLKICNLNRSVQNRTTQRLLIKYYKQTLDHGCFCDISNLTWLWSDLKFCSNLCLVTLNPSTSLENDPPFCLQLRWKRRWSEAFWRKFEPFRQTGEGGEGGRCDWEKQAAQKWRWSNGKRSSTRRLTRHMCRFSNAKLPIRIIRYPSLFC